MKKEEILKDEELVKALEILEINIDDIAEKEEIVKAKDEEEPEEEESEEGGEEEESEEEEVEKGGKKKKEEKPAEEIKKSQEIDLMKSLGEMFTNFSNEQKNILETVTNRISKIEETVDKMASQPLGRKANTHFIEKSFGGSELHDDKGMRILSLSQQKPEIEKAMEDIMLKSTDVSVKSRYESAILTLNAGCGNPSQEIALDMYNNHKIRLVK